MRSIALATGLALISLAAASPTCAGVTSGSVWLNDLSGDASVIPAGAPDSTFSTSAINYDSSVGGYTVGGFLNDPGGAGFSNPGVAGAALNNTHFQFVGTVGLLSGNNKFDVIHDDGLILNIAGFGLVVNEPGPTAAVDTPFTVFNPGAAGNFSFTLDYNECCGPPAVLIWKVNDVVVRGGGVPEPATWALMLTGLFGMGSLLRRNRKASTALA
jgi:hypothetical protein